MAIGERIHLFRTLRGMTQKCLGQMIGFPEKSADVRMVQYETGARTPKADLTAQLAQILDVSPKALAIPDIDTYDGLMHTLFILEDVYGLTVDDVDDVLCIRLDRSKAGPSSTVYQQIDAWHEQKQKLKSGEITKEQYDTWRYHYPEYDTTQLRVKVPPS